MIHSLSSLSGEHIINRPVGLSLTFTQSFIPLNSFAQVKIPKKHLAIICSLSILATYCIIQI